MATSTRTAIGQSCGHLEVKIAGKVIELEGNIITSPTKKRVTFETKVPRFIGLKCCPKLRFKLEKTQLLKR